MDATGWIILRGLCRGLHLAGYFTDSGTMLLAATLLRGQGVAGLRPLAWAGFAIACLGGAGWFLLQTADFAGAHSLGETISALPLVAGQTRFGTLFLARMAALLLAVLLLMAGRALLAACIAFGGVAAEAWLGHGGAMSGAVGAALLVVSVLHLSAAAAWLGALPAFYLAARRLPGPALQRLAQNFSPLGSTCVGTLLVTAMFQFILFITAPPALFTTAYGAVALAKLTLFAGLTALAAFNRFRLTPRLPATRQALLRSVALETAFGLGVLLLAGLIMQLAPPAMAGM